MALRGQWKEWQQGDPVLISRIVWGQPELDQIQMVLDNDWFGPGQKVKELAQAICTVTKHKYCQPVNSGSSALLLAVRQMVDDGIWKLGAKILHPLLTFPTSIAPAIQCGLTPVFVDVCHHTYQIDLDQVELLMAQFGDEIEGMILPHILGNITDMDRLRSIVGDDFPLIEDCCDTLGGYYNGKHVGTFGQIAALSFYGSHHITTGGVGGALLTNESWIYNGVKSMTHWGRNDYDQLHEPYLKFARRYWYDTSGYDFQMTELQAAFAIAQLTRLETANVTRSLRFTQLRTYFERYKVWFYLPKETCDKAKPSWFAFPITIRPEAPFRRIDIAEHLIANKIEIRPIFTGNITLHPAFSHLHGNVFGDTNVADEIGRNGLFLPAWAMSDSEMEYLLGVLETFFLRYN